ncbi:MAG: HlyD family secretion protein [Alphaproteobacteria bacterium]|jgi:membrane fusion protein (multidrug efflux system)|nr:HlyD family secretion protein [Alphaproteobacteria bacterium]
MSENATRIRRPGMMRRAGGFVVRAVLYTLVPLAAAAIGGYFYATGGRFIETENAYVKADKIMISADVSARVVEVAVGENQLVAAGDLLLRLDDEPFGIALARAEARLSEVRAEIEAMRARYREKLTEQQTAWDNVDYYQREFDRRQKLRARGVVPEAKFDEAHHNLTMAHRQIVTIEEQLARLLIDIGGDADLPAERHPQYLHAKAERDRAALDLSDTVISAPTDGIVSKIDLQAGEYVSAARSLFGLVATNGIWIEANLKEIDLTHVRVDQDAVIRVDAYPDREWRGRIKSIGAATGAEFSVLPAQNATGNWVKIVQRVPVRFTVIDYDGEPPLRAGMSVEVEIDTEHERELPEFVTTALAWLARAE